MPSTLVKEKFARDDSGNVGMMFAISLMMILGLTGLALDYTDLVNRNSTLQNASDASVLSAATSGETNLKKLEILAKAAFESNFYLKEGEEIESFELHLSDQNELSLTVKLEKPTLLMGVAGFDSVKAEVQSATLLSSATPLDIAFVLDRTGSMAGQNMTGLINASRRLITDLDSSGRDVRISIVPFSDYVNIGVDSLDLSLLDFPQSGPAGSDVICAMENTSTSGCTSGTSGGTSSSSAASSSSGSCSTTGGGTCTVTTTTTTGSGTTTTTTTTSSGSTMTWTDVSTNSSGGFCTISSDPQENSGSVIEECTPIRPNENWFGCVGSRLSPHNQTMGYDGHKFPPIYNRTCGQPLVPLTDDLVKARASIDSLTASGSTYIPAGLQWGWRTLEPEAPFRSQSTSKRNKLLILMTDGQNTRSQDGTSHSAFDRDTANTLTQDLCSQIKGSDIQVATVSYSFGGSGADTQMLKACASSSGLFYEAKNAASLQKAFESAINQTNEIRLTR